MTTTALDRLADLEALKSRIRMLEQGSGPGEAGQTIRLGLPVLDALLPPEGLPRAALHEVAPEVVEWDDGPAAGFALALLTRLLGGTSKPMLWLSGRDDLCAPALAGFGLEARHMIRVRVRGDREALWAMEEALRSAAPGAVVAEIGSLPRGTSRRLQLAAEAGGVTALLLRRPRSAEAGRLPPSAAVTRWRIAAAPSGEAVLPELPGRARWRVSLIRCRAGRPGEFLMEWDHATSDFSLAAPLRDRSSAPAGIPEGAERPAGSFEAVRACA